MGKPYRIAWATEPGKNYSALLEHAESIRYVLSGMEYGSWELGETAWQNLKEFEPELDLLVPSGRILSCWAVSQGLFARLRAKGQSLYHVAIYHEGIYSITDWRLPDAS